MTPHIDVRVTSAPPSVRGGRGLLRWVCTSNPFYVLSAGLFLIGLWMSFGAQSREVDTWALMSGLAGYTLLLAITACLLVRFGNVWDDVRTVLLLVVLMFLATSVTFDEVLVLDPERGLICYLTGLFFTVVVSEGLLRGTRLILPAWFRGPYYLVLGLFFLYPLALRPLLADPRSEALMWGLFAFAPLAGLVFLTLLPAVRRGPDYVRDNGSPWRWPLYPWVLFGLLGLAVPARSFLLCWSMQLLSADDRDYLVFGPFFLVPFGLALAVLLLEAGLVVRRPGVLGTALVLPAVLIVLTVVGHRDDPIYRQFLALFAARVDDPLSVTLLMSAGFYGYAALRRVSLATEALTAALIALAVVGPDTLDRHELVSPRPTPLLAAAVLQLELGLRRRQSWRWLLAGGLGGIAALAVPKETAPVALLDPVLFHLALFVLLVVGAAFDDTLARWLRLAGSVLVLLAGLAVIFDGVDRPASLPSWVMALYPLVLAVLLAGYGRLLGQRFSVAAAALIVVCWLSVAGGRGYGWLRQIVMGLDQIAWGLALFALAVLVSLGKSGLFGRWLAERRTVLPQTDAVRRDMGDAPAGP